MDETRRGEAAGLDAIGISPRDRVGRVQFRRLVNERAKGPVGGGSFR